MVCISVFLSVVLQMFVFVFDILENCFDWSVSHPEMTSFTVYEITAAHKHTLISLWSYLYPHKGLVLWLKHCVPNRIKVMIVYGFNLKSVHWSLMKQLGWVHTMTDSRFNITTATRSSLVWLEPTVAPVLTAVITYWHLVEDPILQAVNWSSIRTVSTPVP